RRDEGPSELENMKPSLRFSHWSRSTVAPDETKVTDPSRSRAPEPATMPARPAARRPGSGHAPRRAQKPSPGEGEILVLSHFSKAYCWRMMRSHAIVARYEPNSSTGIE